MITFSGNDVIALIMSFLWPLIRILGLIAIAPPFGNNGVPVQIKVILGIMLALIVAPTIPRLENIDAVSLTGILICIQQLLIGLAMGFMMRIAFQV